MHPSQSFGSPEQWSHEISRSMNECSFRCSRASAAIRDTLKSRRVSARR